VEEHSSQTRSTQVYPGHLQWKIDMKTSRTLNVQRAIDDNKKSQNDWWGWMLLTLMKGPGGGAGGWTDGIDFVVDLQNTNWSRWKCPGLCCQYEHESGWNVSVYI
jgi:hypothetical protein